MVFPGSHRALRDAVEARGVAALCAAAGPLRPPLPRPPVELRLKAGDVVLLHPMLAHRRGLNTGPAVRQALIARQQVPRGSTPRARKRLLLKPAVAAAEAAAGV